MGAFLLRIFRHGDCLRQMHSTPKAKWGGNYSGFYAWCPDLKGCQSQAVTLEEVMANIGEVAELYLETQPSDERDRLFSREIPTTAVEVNA